jgi:mRNA-degrading endonuclease toxin of MazEF toxin-antitoxin module
VVLGLEDGLPRASAVRCDSLTLMFKSELINFVGALSALKVAEFNRTLAYALELTGRS